MRVVQRSRESRIRRLWAGLAVITGTVTALALAPAGLPQAQAQVVRTQELSPTITLVSVHSRSMNRTLQAHVLHPAGKPAGLPTFYLLPGAGGAEDGISWYHHGGVRQFFAGKRVNVVLPIGGRFSMMTDWQHDDPALGRNKWQTYYTRELPDSIDRAFRTNGTNALGGVSMSAGPALDLAIQAPRRFRAVASYSGCPGTTDPLGVLSNTTVPMRGGGNPLNMWGPPGSAAWIKHDPVVNAAKLRGKTIFLFAGSGVPGSIDGSPLAAIGGLFGGDVVEGVSLACTTNMHNKLNSLGIPHRFSVRSTGSHSWGLFSAGLRESWPMIARAIGA